MEKISNQRIANISVTILSKYLGIDGDRVVAVQIRLWATWQTDL